MSYTFLFIALIKPIEPICLELAKLSHIGYSDRI